MPSSPGPGPGPGKGGQELCQALKLGTEAHYRDAALYDEEYREREADIQWYRALALRPELAPRKKLAFKILELGAGTGRISIPLAKDGHDIVALDRMSTMLDRLNEKLDKELNLQGSITPLQGDILNLPYDDGTFPMVIAPFNVLMHLYDRHTLKACFDEVHRVLCPGGIFALDVLLPDLEWLTWDPDVRHAVTRFKDPTSGEWMLYSTNHVYDPQTQVCHIKLYYDRPATPRARSLRGATTVKVVELAHRQIFPEELRMLADQSKFEILFHDADFGQSEIEPGAESQSMCLRKAL